MYSTALEAEVTQSPDDFTCVRTTRSITTRKNIEQLSTEEPTNVDDGIVIEDTNEVVAEIDEEEHEPTSCFSGSILSEEEVKLQRKNQVWSSSETNRFYQGLKEYGKNFEQLSKFMMKFKVNRDKVQIQKYYFNLFKAFRAVTKIAEDEIKSLPRDAKELFIVINGCEYKQKTLGSKICPDAFRQLLLNGYASVKLKNRRIVVKTPVCKALRQFFKCDEKFANIPRQLSLRLTPNKPEDKDYVLSCEQNPFLFIQIDMNDSISNAFEFLRLKWLPKHMNPEKIPNESSFLPDIKLVISSPHTIPKLIVRQSNEAHRRLSLKSLIQYCEDRMDGTSSTNEEQMENNNGVLGLSSPSSSNPATVPTTSSVRKKSRVDETPSSIVVDSSSVADFQFKQELLTTGLTRNNVQGMSGLNLYLISGMQNELKMTYSITNLPQRQSSVWDLFVSFVKRDYLWYGTDYMIHGTTHAFRKKKKLRQKKKREAKEAEETKNGETAAIVDGEMLGFLEQWNSMSKTSARLHQPEPVNEVSREQSPESLVESPVEEEQIIEKVVSPQTEVTIPRPRTLINRKRRAIEQIPQVNSYQPNIPKINNSNLPTDFSFLHPNQPSSSTSNQPLLKKVAEESMTLSPRIECIDTNQNSLFPCLERTIDGASLQRALTDEFSNQIGLMAQQNSVDYCRQFEDFVNYFQSPQKTSKLQ